MSDIFVPQSLNQAVASLSIAESLAKLVDPKERAKIADDIKSHHALNETEEKKHSDALSLIKKHQEILDETRVVSEKNKIESESIDKKKQDTDQYCSEENKKIEEKWSVVKIAAETAKSLHTKAEGMINGVAAREDALRKEKEEQLNNAKKLEEDRKNLDKEYEKVEEIKRQHTELLENVKSTQAAIAALAIKK